MCNMVNLDFEPNLCQWIFKSGDAENAVAITEKDSNKVFIFNGKGQRIWFGIESHRNIFKTFSVLVKFSSVNMAIITVEMLFV